jgi:hypothetical protein
MGLDLQVFGAGSHNRRDTPLAWLVVCSRLVRMDVLRTKERRDLP